MNLLPLLIFPADMILWEVTFDFHTRFANETLTTVFVLVSFVFLFWGVMEVIGFADAPFEDESTAE